MTLQEVPHKGQRTHQVMDSGRCGQGHSDPLSSDNYPVPKSPKATFLNLDWFHTIEKGKRKKKSSLADAESPSRTPYLRSVTCPAHLTATMTALGGPVGFSQEPGIRPDVSSSHSRLHTW